MESDQSIRARESNQLLPTQLPAQKWDVAIVGAGPAGSTAATILARYGYSVLLIDKAHFPREKVCGDILLPDTMKVLERLGLGDRVKSIACSLGRLRGVSPSGIEFTVTGGYYSLKREQFDHILFTEASRAGVVCCQADVLTVTPARDHQVSINLRNGESIYCEVGVIATGAEATMAKHAGLTSQCKVNAVALRGYVRSSHEISEGILCYHREIIPGYAWIFPLGDSLYNVGCGVTLSASKQYNLKQMYQTFSTEYPPARELLAHGEQLGHLGGAAIQFGLGGANDAVNGRILAIGETIGTTLPFTGEGIGAAMRSAELAAETIHAAFKWGDISKLATYPDRLDELRPLFRGYDAAQRWLRYPLFNDFAARRIRASKYLQRLCSGVVAGETDPHEIYSLKGILKSFFV